MQGCLRVSSYFLGCKGPYQCPCAPNQGFAHCFANANALCYCPCAHKVDLFCVRLDSVGTCGLGLSFLQSSLTKASIGIMHDFFLYIRLILHTFSLHAPTFLPSPLPPSSLLPQPLLAFPNPLQVSQDSRSNRSWSKNPKRPRNHLCKSLTFCLIPNVCVSICLPFCLVFIFQIFYSYRSLSQDNL